MVTIVHTRDTGTENLINLSSTEAAEEFLNGLADRYEGLPGMWAERTAPGTLTVTGKTIGEPVHIVSTYTINPQETLND